MPLSPDQWHTRYSRQAGWTQQLRRYLFKRAGIQSARLVLDCGCGTGALEADAGGLDSTFEGICVGLDIDPINLAYAKSLGVEFPLSQGDALRLPFAGGTFDITFCHFLLLWVGDPLRALQELRRVTRPGGCVLALAEPDYGGRIDFPPELELLGSWQQASLRSQGANPWIGRRLGWMFHQTGLEEIETGVLGAHWSGSPSNDELESEWAVLNSDLEIMLGTGDDAPWQAEFDKLKRLDEITWKHGERVLYVPTFYAIGKNLG